MKTKTKICTKQVLSFLIYFVVYQQKVVSNTLEKKKEKKKLLQNQVHMVCEVDGLAKENIIKISLIITYKSTMIKMSSSLY
jgi:hypothetical protein